LGGDGQRVHDKGTVMLRPVETLGFNTGSTGKSEQGTTEHPPRNAKSLMPRRAFFGSSIAACRALPPRRLGPHSRLQHDVLQLGDGTSLTVAGPFLVAPAVSGTPAHRRTLRRDRPSVRQMRELPRGYGPARRTIIGGNRVPFQGPEEKTACGPPLRRKTGRPLHFARVHSKDMGRQPQKRLCGGHNKNKKT